MSGMDALYQEANHLLNSPNRGIPDNEETVKRIVKDMLKEDIVPRLERIEEQQKKTEDNIKKMDDNIKKLSENVNTIMDIYIGPAKKFIIDLAEKLQEFDEK